MLLPALLVAMQAVPPVVDYWPGPWVVFTDARWRGEVPSIIVDVARAAEMLPATRLVLCAEGAGGGESARIAAVRRMLLMRGIAAGRLRLTVCADRDTTRPAGVRIAIR